MKCHVLLDISRSLPCCGFFILVGKYIVTLASCSIHGRFMIGGGVESSTGELMGVLVELSWFSSMVMMSPDDGIWIVLCSDSWVGTVMILVCVDGKVGWDDLRYTV